MRCYKCMEEIEAKVCPHCGAPQHNEPQRSKQLAPGTVLKDRYFIGYACEETAVFTAYAAWDLRSERRLIINEYFPQQLCTRAGNRVKPRADGKSEQIFKNGLDCIRRETEDLRAIHNVDVVGGFEANSTYYTIRKYIKRMNVAQLLDGNYDLNKDYARRVLILLLRTLNSVSKLGIVHGNIKPESIFFNEDTSVTVANFAFCGYLANHIQADTNDGYSALELYSVGSKPSPTADVYSAAAVFYRLLTGEKPPRATDRAKLENLAAPSVLGVEIKPNIENALLNALNIMPENRTKTPKDFYDELKNPKTARNWERFTAPEKKRLQPKGRDFFRLGVWAIVGIMAVAFVITMHQYKTIKTEAENAPRIEVSTESVEDRLQMTLVPVTDYTTETTTKEKYFTDADKIDNPAPKNNSGSSSGSNNSSSASRRSRRDYVTSGGAIN